MVDGLFLFIVGDDYTLFFFFFSSRRRHTRFDCDWSSDVCSSDLKGTEDIKNIAMQTLEGHLRAILGTMTVEEIYQNRAAFASKVQEVAAGDMANMGLTIVSFTIRDIRDTQGYLDALGKPRIAQVKRDAQIAQAEADRDAMIRSSQAIQAGQEAKFEADTRIAEAQRDYQSNVAQYQAAVNQKKAEADLANDLQKYKTGHLVKAGKVQVNIA